MKYIFFLLLSSALSAQSNQPTPLTNVFIPGIQSTTILDNRSSVNRQLTYSSIACSGSGTWSVSLQYASSTSGPWTAVPGAATVTNASSPTIAYGFLLNYPNYYRVAALQRSSNTLQSNYRGAVAWPSWTAKPIRSSPRKWAFARFRP